MNIPEFNTLADVLAACVNSLGGVAGDGSPCGTLFASVTYPGQFINSQDIIPPSSTPTDTLQAFAESLLL